MEANIFKLQKWKCLSVVFTCVQCSAWLLLCLVVSLKLYSKFLLMMAWSVWYHLMFYEKHPDQNTSLGRLKKKKNRKEKDRAFKFSFSDCFGSISLRDAHCGFKVLKPQHLALRDSWCLPEHPHHCLSDFFWSPCNTEETGIQSIFVSMGR